MNHANAFAANTLRDDTPRFMGAPEAHLEAHRPRTFGRTEPCLPHGSGPGPGLSRTGSHLDPRETSSPTSLHSVRLGRDQPVSRNESMSVAPGYCVTVSCAPFSCDLRGAPQAHQGAHQEAHQGAFPEAQGLLIRGDDPDCLNSRKSRWHCFGMMVDGRFLHAPPTVEPIPDSE